ncbi:molybdate ABC transporter substrate-binding protein [Anaeromyxobacter oryzae]|uniref:Molybdate ABC transporter substrate-binding protein n=1 Tax=Anaeromyxobacter oryzae TaxID=2918170 RepID=A0ABN6MT59_9BACT|nr:molybdate ABC transporter substrate-binding protein [Anaeromyxobacter oryzae]BDG04164.1 molybdate ABC transporter substrate-binding protein [Anaeromyxobacter oryzae]
MSRVRLRLAVACAVLPVLTAAPTRAEGPRRTVAVAAAANLKPAMDALTRAFEAGHPGVTVAVTTGASGTFVAQLRSGAPFDVFFSADRDYPRRVVEQGLATAEGEVVYAVGALVVWTAPGSSVDVGRRGLAALADPSVKHVAIANPAVAPYGRAAETALRAAGVLDAVRDRLVFGQNVSQAAQFAESGAADAALIPLSLASSPPLARGTIHPVPPSSYPPLEQSVVILKAAREPALARAFVAFVTGPEGRAILARSGYGVP